MILNEDCLSAYYITEYVLWYIVAIKVIYTIMVPTYLIQNDELIFSENILF